MISILLAPFVAVYAYTLQPIAPFTWFGLSFSTLDVVAAFRLCLALRSAREGLRSQHISRHGPANLEQGSFVKSLATTLTIVYGGEAFIAPMLGATPSFMISGVTPALYAAVQAVVEHLPSAIVPGPALNIDLPLSVVDGFTRALLVCTLVPPVVVKNASPAVASSPWTLLLTSLMVANGGFFLTNLSSALKPSGLTLITPPELGPYGWATTDLWCAPLATGVYALLTHAQPVWADAHAAIIGFLGGVVAEGEKGVQPVDAETARAACAALLAVLFVSRTVKNYAAKEKAVAQTKANKTKTQ